jgi:hypothetical protein
MQKLVHLGDLEVVLPLAAALAAWLLAARAWRITLRWLLLFGAALFLVGITKIAFLGWGTGLHALDFKAISGHATCVTALYPFLAYVVLYRPDLAGEARRAHNVPRAVNMHGAETMAGTGNMPGTGTMAGTRNMPGTETMTGIENTPGTESVARSGRSADTACRAHAGYFAKAGKLATAGPLAGWLGLIAGLLLGGVVSSLLVASGEHSVAEALAGWLLGAAVSLGSAMTAPDLGGGRMLPTVWWTIPVFALGASLMESAHVGYWMIKMALALSGSERPYSWDTCGLDFNLWS